MRPGEQTWPVTWAGETKLGPTSGWLGLPTTGASSWLALEPPWWNEVPLYAKANRTDGNGSGDTGFRDRALSTPRMGLKPHLSRGVPR